MSPTSTARRPSFGMRLATPSSRLSVESGSISITISSPGFTTRPGISALTDFARVPSSTSVGTGVDLPGMSTLCVSRPFR